MHLRALRTLALCTALVVAVRPVAARADDPSQDIAQETTQDAAQGAAQEGAPALDQRVDAARVESPGEEVAQVAAQYVGAAYRWGGNTPAGFDCSGFVQWVYGRFGLPLPHSEIGQLYSGERVSAEALEPGDVLVFANTYRAGPSHSGIYLGGGTFVHAVDERHGVMVSSLWDSYWGPRLMGASRPLAYG